MNAHCWRRRGLSSGRLSRRQSRVVPASDSGAIDVASVAYFTSETAAELLQIDKIWIDSVAWMTARGTADKVRIAEWLKLHGLAQYARAFKEHNIGFDVLPGLGDENLKNSGCRLATVRYRSC